MTGTDASEFILAVENTTSFSSNPEVQSALKEALPILVQIGLELEWSDIKHMFTSLYKREPLHTRYVSFVVKRQWFKDIALVSWTSTGSTVTLPTRVPHNRDLKFTTTIYTIRELAVHVFFGCLHCSFRFGVGVLVLVGKLA